MHIFPIKKLDWDEQEENWVETEEILGYQAIAPDGSIIAKGETISEVSESALVSAYLSESNAIPAKEIKLGRRMFSLKMLSKVSK